MSNVVPGTVLHLRLQSVEQEIELTEQLIASAADYAAVSRRGGDTVGAVYQDENVRFWRKQWFKERYQAARLRSLEWTATRFVA